VAHRDQLVVCQAGCLSSGHQPAWQMHILLLLLSLLPLLLGARCSGVHAC
jgi:hypothetical protein